MFDLIKELFADIGSNTTLLMMVVCAVLALVFWFIRDNYQNSANDIPYHIFNTLMYLSLIVLGLFALGIL